MLFTLCICLTVCFKFSDFVLGAFGRVYIGTLISSENGEEQRVFIKTVTGKLAAYTSAKLCFYRLFMCKCTLIRNLLDYVG